jgi:ferric-dicitrate binding protein FerR (iron transport regulator)
MSRPHTPPRDLDDAVAAARGWEPSEAFMRMHAARDQAARRARQRHVARVALVCAAAIAAVALLTTDAWPQTWRGELGSSSVTLRPSEEPGAVLIYRAEAVGM